MFLIKGVLDIHKKKLPHGQQSGQMPLPNRVSTVALLLNLVKGNNYMDFSPCVRATSRLHWWGCSAEAAFLYIIEHLMDKIYGMCSHLHYSLLPAIGTGRLNLDRLHMGKWQLIDAHGESFFYFFIYILLNPFLIYTLYY